MKPRQGSKQRRPPALLDRHGRAVALLLDARRVAAPSASCSSSSRHLAREARSAGAIDRRVELLAAARERRDRPRPGPPGCATTRRRRREESRQPGGEPGQSLDQPADPASARERRRSSEQRGGDEHNARSPEAASGIARVRAGRRLRSALDDGAGLAAPGEVRDLSSSAWSRAAGARPRRRVVTA